MTIFIHIYQQSHILKKNNYSFIRMLIHLIFYFVGKSEPKFYFVFDYLKNNRIKLGENNRIKILMYNSQVIFAFTKLV